MNAILYAASGNGFAIWDGDKADFDELKRLLLANCRLACEPCRDCLLLPADSLTKEVVQKYAVDKETVSKRNSRKLSAFVGKLAANQPFWLINGVGVSDFARLSAFESLLSNGARDVSGVRVAFDRLFNSYAPLSMHYSLFAFGFDGLRYYAGEADKEKRVCRFCGRRGVENFSDDAHAIPEALGNKILFCHEECDTCNHSLNLIEDNLTALMDVRRALFRIKRKKASDVPEINGQNFAIRDDGNGNPLIYVMEDSLPADRNMPEFSVRLNLKYTTTNENILKSLTKIAIDLMPSQFLGEFKETVEWLTSGGHFMPDCLPSCHSACLPDGIFYEQPQLLLYVKHDENFDAPFCFALLRIYDICYRYVIPFATPDKGKFRKDDSLSGFWKRFVTVPALHWEAQNTSDWWHSAPWVDLTVKAASPFFKPLPASDPIFEKCRQTPIAPPKDLVSFPDFDPGSLRIVFKTLSFKDLSKRVRVTREMLADTSNDIITPIFAFDAASRCVFFSFSLTARAADNSRKYFSVEIKAQIISPDFDDQIQFDETHCEVNVDFIAAVWDKVMAEASRQIDNKKRLTQFKSVNIGEHFGSDNRRLLRESIYRFVTADGKVCNIPFKCLHEEMPEAKRKQLIQAANARQ